jgi:hypothetical protein
MAAAITTMVVTGTVMEATVIVGMVTVPAMAVAVGNVWLAGVTIRVPSLDTGAVKG